MEAWGLIEKRQWWLKHKNVLYVRPTQLTQDFLQMATTWKAANELNMAQGVKNQAIECCEIADQSSADLASNQFGATAEPASAMLPISNDNKLYHLNSKQTVILDPSAKPKFEVNTEGSKTKLSGKNMADLAPPVDLGKTSSHFACSDLPHIGVLFGAWKDLVMSHSPGSLLSDAPKQFGALAVILETLQYSEPKFHDRILDIISYAAKNWVALETTSATPNACELMGCLNVAVNNWIASGKPACS